VARYGGAARHFAHWLTDANISAAEIGEDVLDRFARHRCRCLGFLNEQLSVRSVQPVTRFVEFLAAVGIVSRPTSPDGPGLDPRLIEYQEWARKHRDLCETTIRQHVRMLGRLLPSLRRRPSSWDAEHIRNVVLAEAKRTTRPVARIMAIALRSYLRFLSANGRCRPGLEHAVPAFAEWRLSTLPRYIDAAQVEQVIATCDPSTMVGLRGRAILLLLARLGLRAGDIVTLRLGDFDWQRATVSVSGKSRRETRLPLPQDAGDAVLAYLERGRPQVESDRVFFMLNAPIRPLPSGNCVAAIVRGAVRKVGLDVPSSGAHLLRHSAATAMLRGGATLDMVGSVLRHRSPDTTALYAKVDIKMLRQIAQAWPEGVSC